MFRSFLVRIRKIFLNDKRRYFLLSGVVVVIFLTISMLTDSFLPFVGWSNFVRAVLLFPFSFSLFALGYGLSLHMHNQRVAQNPEWQPYRLRFSFKWRVRIAIVGAALVFVLMYSAGKTILYTTMASIFVSFIIGLLAFMRRTSEETFMADHDIPDVRDISYDVELERLKNEPSKKDKKKAETE